ncbi:MAG: LLM class flavin-dependent oxidoreductase [Acidobacteriota bacterium]|nr:LLM class flavin-dependent oxidoreductase [Acidobacteriota bacterium]MDH3786665.1 LLM class flavin-dependent oxidoreductase [Acidobacteriota bacterium]
MKRSLFFLLDHHPDSTDASVADRLHETVDQAVLAERLGFDTVWIAEHHFHQLGIVPNPAVLLAAIAERTTTLRLGPAVSVLPMRPALSIAEDYALVDSLSDGRLNLGVGSGNEFELLGVGVDPDERHAVFSRSLAEILGRFRRSQACNKGYDTLNLPVVQTPSPPIYVASMSAERSFEIGVEGHNLLTLATPRTGGIQELTEQVEAHRKGLAEGGHEKDSAEAVVVVFGFAAGTETDTERIGGPCIARVLKAMADVDLEPGAAYEMMRAQGIAPIGDEGLVADRIQQLRDAEFGHIAFLHGFGALDGPSARASIEILSRA